MTDNVENIKINADPAIAPVRQLSKRFEELQVQAFKAGVAIEDALKKLGIKKISPKSGVIDKDVRNALKQLNELSGINTTLGKFVATPSTEATLRNAELRRAKAENLYAETLERAAKRIEREAGLKARVQNRADELNTRIGLAPEGSAQRIALEIQRQRAVVDREHQKYLLGQTNEYKQQQAILNGLLAKQQQMTQSKKAEAAATRNITQEERVRRSAQTGISIAKERVTGSGAADTFGIQTQLTANFLVISQLSSVLRFTAGFITEFDRALYNLQAITAASDGTMASFRDTIEEVASRTKFTAVEVANAAVILGQAGFTAREVQQALSGVAQFASAAGIEMTQAVGLITTALSVFNLRAEEATNAADIFTAAINKSKLTSEQLSLAFSYVANTASQSGVAFSELTTLLAALANAGIRSGSTIGTNLRALFVDLQTPSEKLVNTLQSLGLTLGDIDLQTNGAIGVIQNLRNAGFGATEAFATLETRSAAAFVALSGQADTLSGIQASLVGTGAAAAASDTQMKSLANTIANFQSVFGTLALKAFEPMIRLMQSFVEATNNVLIALSEDEGLVFVIKLLTSVITAAAVVGLTRFLLKIAGVEKTVKGLSIAMAASTAAIRSQAIGISALGVAVSKTQTGFVAAAASLLRFRTAGIAAAVAMRGLQAAVSFMTGPVGLLFLGLSVLPAILGSTSSGMEKLKKNVDDTRTAVQQSSAALLEAKTVYQSLTNEINLIERQQDRLQDGSDALRTKILQLVDSYGDLGISLDSQNSTYEETRTNLYRLRDAYNDVATAANIYNGATLRKNLEAEQQLVNEIKALDLFGGRGNADRFARALKATSPSYSFSKTDALISEQAPSNLTNPLIAADAFSRNNLPNTAKIFDAIASGTLNSLSADRDIPNATFELKERFTTNGVVNPIVDPLLENLKSVENQLRNLENIRRQIEENTKQEEIDKAKENPAVVAAANELGTLTLELTRLVDRAQRTPEFSADPAQAEKDLRAKGDEILTRIDLAKQTGYLSKTQQTALDQLVDNTVNVAIGVYKTALNELEEDAIKTSQTITAYELSRERENISAAIESLRQAKNTGQAKVERDAITAAARKFVALSLKKAALDAGLTESEFVIENGNIRRTDGLQFTKSQLVTFQEVINQGSAFGNARDEAYQTAQRRIDTNSLAENIKSNNLLLGQLERDLSVNTKRLESGTYGRRTLDEVYGERIAILEKMNRIEEENLALEIAKSENLSELDILERRQALADKQADRRERIDSDYRNERVKLPALDFQDAINDLRRELIPNEFETETLTAANYFRDTMLAAAEASRKGFDDFFKSVLTGQKSVGAGARDMAIAVLDAMLSVITSKIAEQFVNLLVNLAFSLVGSAASGGTTVGNDFTGVGTGFAYMGGLVKRRAGGGITTRDSQLYLLQPGEFVMRKSAVDAIGADNLSQINARGNAVVSNAQQSIPQMPAPMESVTNVWIVSPDQKPPPGPKDIVAIVTEDINRGGSLKKMIKSVRNGSI